MDEDKREIENRLFFVLFCFNEFYKLVLIDFAFTVEESSSVEHSRFVLEQP